MSIWLSRIAWLLVGIAIIRTGCFWWVSASQPLVDFHSFRQTQTALTALFLDWNPASMLNYETPVLGSPWSLPFEFPFYQYIVSLISRGLKIDLTLAGRVVSIAFGLACAWPAVAIMRLYRQSGFAQVLFLGLYLSSSVYMYWNRAFMIESAALYFTLMFLYCYLLLRFRGDSMASGQHALISFAIAIYLAAALLIKATTALLPFLLVSIDLLICSCRQVSGWRVFLRRTFVPVSISLMVGFWSLTWWTHHADAAKSLNPFAKNLTSSALSSWNYGTLSQRLSGSLWVDVVAERMLPGFGFFGVIILVVLAAWKVRAEASKREFLLASILLGFGPLFIFTNLHVVHAYYQVANQVYLLLALAASAAVLMGNASRYNWQASAAAVVLLIFVISDVDRFNRFYLPFVGPQTSETYELARLVDRSIPRQSALLVLGDDWNSSFAYHSRRRSLTLPDWFQSGPQSLASILANPEAAIKPYLLGAIVVNRDLPDETLNHVCRGWRRIQADSHGGWRAYLCKQVN